MRSGGLRHAGHFGFDGRGHFIAALLGSTAAFLVARHGARSFVEARVQGDPRFAAIDRATRIDVVAGAYSLHSTTTLPGPTPSASSAARRAGMSSASQP